MRSLLATTALALATLTSGSLAEEKAGWLSRAKIKDGETEVASVKFYEGGRVKIEIAGKPEIAGKMKPGGKRKYDEQPGVEAKSPSDKAEETPVAEVKFEDQPGGDFKLRTPAGKLLQKVKRSKEKIKIAANEEMENALEIKVSESGDGKIKRGDKTLGEVKFYPEKGRLKLKDAAGKELFEIRIEGKAKPAMDLSIGALALPDADLRERLILMAELFHGGN
ncbi:MAG: hypothetical protein R3F11_30545 [Verrucomicrobiales bacterium]